MALIRGLLLESGGIIIVIIIIIIISIIIMIVIIKTYLGSIQKYIMVLPKNKTKINVDVGSESQ